MTTGRDRLESVFRRAAEEGRGALVTYVMAGAPDMDTSEALVRVCLEAGADVVELGFPYSDPIADGPTLQRAAERSLAGGTRLKDVLALAARLRADFTSPIVLMGYLNPVLAFGEARFFEACVASGVDGIILPDLPPEEGEELRAHARDAGVAIVPLLTPTSHEGRIEAAMKGAGGFAYYVSVSGVTGARAELPDMLPERLDAVRRQSHLPVAVGFGISSSDQVRMLVQHAEGVVVGSAIAQQMAAGGVEAAKAFVASLVAGLKKRRAR